MEELRPTTDRLVFWMKKLTGKEDLNSNSVSLPERECTGQVRHLQSEFEKMKRNWDQVKQLAYSLHAQMSAGECPKHSELTAFGKKGDARSRLTASLPHLPPLPPKRLFYVA